MLTMWHTPAPELERRLDAEFYLPSFLENVRQIRAAGRAQQLGDIEVEGTYGVLPGSEEYSTGPVPLFRGGDLEGQAICGIPTAAPRVPKRYLESSRGRLRPGEVLLLVKGETIDSPKSVGIVPDGWSIPAVVNGSVYKFRVSAPHDPYFVCAYFGTPSGLAQKTRAIANTGINYNDQDSIRAFWVPLPHPSVQAAIGNKLRKAARLRELAAAGRRGAQAAMDLHAPKCTDGTAMTSWVRPESLGERMDTQPYRSHFLSLSQALTSAGAVEVREVATVSGGDPVSSDEFRQSGVPLVRIRDIQPGGFGPSDDSVTNEYFRSRPAAAARHGRIVVGMDGEFRAQFFIESDLPRLVNQRVAIIDCFAIRAELVVAWLNRPEGQLQLARWAVQTTVAHTSLEHIRSLRVPRMPPSEEEAAAEGLLLARRAVAEATKLVDHARTSVEALIAGTLDEAALLAESDVIEAWLVANPSPDAKA